MDAPTLEKVEETQVGYRRFLNRVVRPDGCAPSILGPLIVSFGGDWLLLNSSSFRHFDILTILRCWKVDLGLFSKTPTRK